MIYKVDLLKVVFWLVAIVLASQGLVSWWVLFLFALYSFSFTVSWKR